MTNYFGFIDETGVLQGTSGQRFFALGLLKCEDTSKIYESLQMLKNRAEAHLNVVKKIHRSATRMKPFEFKFSSMTRESQKFYLEMIDLFLTYPKNKFCCFVIDKVNPKINIDEVFPNAWDAYISYSKLLIKKNVNRDEQICIIADFLGKPKSSPKYYELEIKQLPGIYNATFLESHSSLFVQLVDILVGSVVFDFRRTRQPENPHDFFKGQVCDHLKKSLNIDTLAKNITKSSDPYFSVWEFEPK